MEADSAEDGVHLVDDSPGGDTVLDGDLDLVGLLAPGDEERRLGVRLQVGCGPSHEDLSDDHHVGCRGHDGACHDGVGAVAGADGGQGLDGRGILDNFQNIRGDCYYVITLLENRLDGINNNPLTGR